MITVLCQIHPFQPTMDKVGLGVLKPQENIRNPCPPSLDPTNSQAHDWILSTLHLDPSLTKWFLNALASVRSGPYIVELLSLSEKGSTPGPKGRNFSLPSGSPVKLVLINPKRGAASKTMWSVMNPSIFTKFPTSLKSLEVPPQFLYYQ